MALTPRRHRFGATSADVTQSKGADDVASFVPNVVLWTWSQKQGGERLTDLALDAAGASPITSITSDANGQVPEFYGPAGVTEVWVAVAEDTTGTRVLLAASDLAADLATLDAAIGDIQVEAGIQTINTSIIPDPDGNVELGPDDLVPSGATQEDVVELQNRIYTTTVVQVGNGYPPRPSYATYVNWVGTVDPGAAAVDGDSWDFPSA